MTFLANRDVQKKSEKPKESGGDDLVKPSFKPEMETNRTQPSKSIKVKDDDDTVKNIESLKEDKEKSEQLEILY